MESTSAGMLVNISQIIPSKPLMAWRLHLTNHSIQQLDILDGVAGKPALLAAWWRRDRVMYYDLQRGLLIADETIEFPDVDDRNTLAWQNFIKSLAAPNGAPLPRVRTAFETIYRAQVGETSLYRVGPAEIYLHASYGSDEVRLDVRGTKTLTEIAFDPSGEYTAALDNKAKLHLYRGEKRLGFYSLQLSVDGVVPSLAIARKASAVYISTGRDIVKTNSTGSVLQRITTHFDIGSVLCSPDGQWVVATDLESGVIRVYGGADLKLRYQRFAIDLLANARQLQLLADLPPTSVAPNALAISDDGTLALALSGILCVTSLDEMIQIQSGGLQQSLF
jgi:hypothetical protein